MGDKQHRGKQFHFIYVNHFVVCLDQGCCFDLCSFCDLTSLCTVASLITTIFSKLNWNPRDCLLWRRTVFQGCIHSTSFCETVSPNYKAPLCRICQVLALVPPCVSIQKDSLRQTTKSALTLFFLGLSNLQANKKQFHLNHLKSHFLKGEHIVIGCVIVFDC